MLPLLHRFKRPRVVCELQRIGLMRQYAQECIRTRGATSRPPCGPRETHGVQMVDPDQDGGVAVSRRGLPAQLGPIPEDGERIEQSCLKRQISRRPNLLHWWRESWWPVRWAERKLLKMLGYWRCGKQRAAAPWSAPSRHTALFQNGMKKQSKACASSPM